MKNRCHGVIYKIQNKINGRIYIGQTTESNPQRRINRHFKKQKSKDLVFLAILKYGIENFESDIICSCSNQENLNFLEEYFINTFNSKSPNGYNIKSGGDQGGKCPEETKKLIGERIRDWYSKNEHPFKGKKFSEEHRENLSKVRKGFTSEAREKALEERIKRKRENGEFVSVRAIRISDGESFEFETISDCAKELGLHSFTISRVLRGYKNMKQHKGYRFERIQKTLDSE